MVLKKGKNKRYLIFVMLGIFFFLLSSSYLIYDYYTKEQEEFKEVELIEDFFDSEEVVVEEEIIKDEEVTTNKTPVSVNYIGVLEIPKINLKKGLCAKDDSSNNVNKNIYVVNESIFPNNGNISHIILASHSGNSKVSYFKNLKKMELKDKVYLYYNGYKYIYELSNIYEVDKTGKIVLNQTTTSDITLITCVSGTDKQVVYVGNLIGKEEY